MYILDTTIEEEQQQTAIAAIEAAIVEAGAEVVKTVAFGQRRLAYPIDNHNEGLYMLTYSKSDKNVAGVLNHEFSMIEPILRGMTVIADLDHIFKSTEELAVEAAEKAAIEEKAAAEDAAAAEKAAAKEEAAAAEKAAAAQEAAAAEEAAPAEETAEEAPAEEAEEAAPAEEEAAPAEEVD